MMKTTSFVCLCTLVIGYAIASPTAQPVVKTDYKESIAKEAQFRANLDKFEETLNQWDEKVNELHITANRLNDLIQE